MLPRSLLSPSQYIVFDPLVREFNDLLLAFLRIKKSLLEIARIQKVVTFYWPTLYIKLFTSEVKKRRRLFGRSVVVEKNT